VVTYYNNEKQYVTDINDIDTAKEAAGKVVSDTKAFALNTLKPLAIQKLNEVVNPLIENIAYDEIKNTVQSFYDTEMGKVAELETLSDVAGFYKVIFEDVKSLLVKETQKALVALKNKAIGELDTYLSALIEKIPYDGLKTDIRTFYTTEKEKIQAVDTIEGVTPCVNEIKGDLQTFALTETKKIALSQLDEIVNAALDKMPNEELRDDLAAFYAVEKAKINAVTEVQNVPATLSTVISETSAHIKELLASTVKNYFARLTQVENTTAYDYLPAAMLPTYQNNLVTASDINYDFTEFTSVSAISKAGYGEQWQMVLENVAQSASMAKVFNVAQTVLTAAGNAVDIYVTNSYSEEINYVFDTEDYSGNFTFDGSMLVFRVTLKKSVTMPVFGSVRPQIKMEYDLSKDAKGMFISLGDAFKVKYVVSDNAYEMATTYQVTAFGKTGSRTAYLSIERLESGMTVGHIYEYTTYEGNDLIKSCADFYINDQFVSVVGNKASGMIGYDGYVNELYKTDEGRLLGYEVREEKTIAGFTATYNTLWFNLWDVQGLNTVKVTDKTDANKSSRSTVDVYLNGSSALLSPTYNTKIIKTSRKYDIELRSRFYYTYDAETNAYVANEVSVPMLFVQEGDNFNSFTSDIQKDNGVAASIGLNSNYLNKILLDYDTLIDIFIENKDNMSSEKIIEYLGRYED
ncbi:MAG: hypothetical protein IJS67_04600, partial [Clostridia bacterium]|nr:hypothetical protein [Clostridia bacterium]